MYNFSLLDGEHVPHLVLLDLLLTFNAPDTFLDYLQGWRAGDTLCWFQSYLSGNSVLIGGHDWGGLELPSLGTPAWSTAKLSSSIHVIYYLHETTGGGHLAVQGDCHQYANNI